MFLKKFHVFLNFFLFFLFFFKMKEYSLQEYMLSMHLFNVLYITFFIYFYFFIRSINFFLLDLNYLFFCCCFFLYFSGVLWSFSSWGIYYFGSWFFLFSLFFIFYFLYFFYKWVEDKKYRFTFFFTEFCLCFFLFIYLLLRNSYQTIHQNTKTVVLTEYLLNHDILYFIVYLIVFSVFSVFFFVISDYLLFENRRIAQW